MDALISSKSRIGGFLPKPTSLPANGQCSAPARTRRFEPLLFSLDTSAGPRSPLLALCHGGYHLSINFGPFCIVDLLLYISVTVLDSRAKMAIVLKLDEVMAERGMSLGELAARVGITNVNMSRLKTG